MLWLDAVQRIAGAYTPKPIRYGYEAMTSILYSLYQISNQLSSMGAKPQSSVGNSPVQTSGGGAPPSTWGGSSSGLPSTVVQNGITYVRNSSGLLNIAK
jgi:hypothetical protein